MSDGGKGSSRRPGENFEHGWERIFGKLDKQTTIDYARCKPVKPDTTCEKCKRWAELPGQTWGDKSVVVVTANSKDPSCIHITLSELDADQ